MEHNRQEPDHRYDVPWSIPGGDPAADNKVVDLANATVQPNWEAHCPACLSHSMESITTRDDSRFEHCRACGRLWRRRDGRLHLALDLQTLDRR